MVALELMLQRHSGGLGVSAPCSALFWEPSSDCSIHLAQNHFVPCPHQNLGGISQRLSHTVSPPRHVDPIITLSVFRVLSDLSRSPVCPLALWFHPAEICYKNLSQFLSLEALTLPLAHLSQNCSPHIAFLGGLGDVAPPSICSSPGHSSLWVAYSTPGSCLCRLASPCLEESLSTSQSPPCPPVEEEPPRPPHCACLSCLLCFLYTAAIIQLDNVLLSFSICFHQECKSPLRTPTLV